MVVITLFLIEPEENVRCSEMPISINSVRQSRFSWYIFVRIFISNFGSTIKVKKTDTVKDIAIGTRQTGGKIKEDKF